MQHRRISTGTCAVMAAAMTLLLMVHALPAHAERRGAKKYRPIGISLIGPVALFHDRNTVIIGLSVNLLSGRSRAVYGAELGMLNRVEEDVGLLQIALLGSMVGGGCYGICAAGLFNIHGRLGGLQASLFGNDAASVSLGLQIGLLNGVRANADFAIQIGLTNVNNRRLEDLMAMMAAKDGDVVLVAHYLGTQRGIQLGVFNSSKDYRGLQLGLFNLANGKGMQVAGVNFSSRYSGIQVGAWNHATRMKGIQLGLINTAKYLKGIQIGAINVATQNTIPFTVLINAGF